MNGVEQLVGLQCGSPAGCSSDDCAIGRSKKTAVSGIGAAAGVAPQLTASVLCRIPSLVAARLGGVQLWGVRYSGRLGERTPDSLRFEDDDIWKHVSKS